LPILLKVDKGKNYARQTLNLWADLIVQGLCSAPKRRVGKAHLHTRYSVSTSNWRRFYCWHNSFNYHSWLLQELPLEC